MKKAFIYCLVGTLFFYGCEENTNDILTLPDENLSWEDSYTVVLNGATSLKIESLLTRPGAFYYVVSKLPLESRDAASIKSLALSSVEGDVITRGLINVTNKNVGDTVETVVRELTSESTYFTYTVSEAVVEGESAALPDIVKSFENNLLERQTENSIDSEVLGKKMGYLAYALEDYYLNPQKDYPLLIFLHGMGEYAAEGEFNLYRNTTVPQLIHNGNDYPFVVISPQLTTGSWSPDFVDELIGYIIQHYRIDESRIYMTGISLGGIGTWNYTVKYPERLAAVVPISGSGDPSKACNMSKVPVWAFHNATDGMVNTSGSVNMIEALNTCDPKCPVTPKLTLYPDAGHNAWVRTYNGSAGYDIFSWFLTYKK